MIESIRFVSRLRWGRRKKTRKMNRGRGTVIKWREENYIFVLLPFFSLLLSFENSPRFYNALLPDANIYIFFFIENELVDYV